MTIHDDLGLAYSGANADSLAHYRRALHQFQCYIEPSKMIRKPWLALKEYL